MDQFFTPPEVADALVRVAHGPAPRVVADFAAGDGALLVAAAQRWPNATFVANDADPTVARRVRRSHAEWAVTACDFIDHRSRWKSCVLRRFAGAVDLVLLNPPFSTRGGTCEHVSVDGDELRCSRALAFLLCALEYTRSSGQVCALVPEGSLDSQRDARAWQWLRANASVEIGPEFGAWTFRSCSAATVAVRLSAWGSARAALRDDLPRMRPASISVRVVRGTLQMHEYVASARGASVVHSTDLQCNAVRLSTRRTDLPRRRICGPAVLLPRVGKPNKGKIAQLASGIEVVPSDCVIGLACDDTETARRVYRLLGADWSALRTMYRGTCAQHLTVARLSLFLAERGVAVAPFQSCDQHDADPAA